MQMYRWRMNVVQKINKTRNGECLSNAIVQRWNVLCSRWHTKYTGVRPVHRTISEHYLLVV